MGEWEVANYLIDAKMDIDSMLFIKLNRNELINIDLKRKIDSIQMDFYIKLCVILDNTICKNNKKQICLENKIIDSIYYERDKDKAHKDIKYVRKNESNYNETISRMKKEIEEVKKVAEKYLPKEITFDYVPHDKELFRLVNGVRKDVEDRISKEKYNQNKYEEFNTIQKNVYNDVEEIRYIPESKRKEYAVIVENGINMYEGLQNRQRACIKMNVLYGLNCWCEFDKEKLDKWNRLKEEGFIDIFDIPRNIAIWSDQKWNSFYEIMNEEE